MSREERFPGVWLQLLDTKREPLGLRVDCQNDGLYHLALLEYLGRVLESLRPGQIGYVHQTVDAFFNLDECAEIRHAADPALDHRADAVSLFYGSPRIGFELLQPQRNAPFARVQIEH